MVLAEINERFAKAEKLAMGLCPYCDMPIRGWKPVFGSFAPEWWATQREHGIDPATGHAAQCAHKEVTL